MRMDQANNPMKFHEIRVIRVQRLLSKVLSSHKPEESHRILGERAAAAHVAGALA